MLVNEQHEKLGEAVRHAVQQFFPGHVFTLFVVGEESSFIVSTDANASEHVQELLESYEAGAGETVHRNPRGH